ncbi:MAG TPA: malonyl-CoA decarboxylase family protein [Eoetvoesiella sp.]|uniref:malonyl-CoA decarboxylase domain-containing protein n=1 Tax=Eoetvoesiella sp. TaxID=1966355 RepID=UPI002C040273|nr:malonyl-CoA decarboxylase family protein [Eoetvoesiella sp.]HWK61340.1 malonyl-CoA decarboxylase family protein [Eoetvoesiella sp.]
MTELHTLARASNTPPGRADDDTDRPASKTQESSGLITRLGRWWERERRLTPAELKPLYTARLTDVGANRAAKQWCLQYGAADGKDRRAMLTQLVETGATLDPRADQGLLLLRRLNMQAAGLQFMVELRADMLRWRNQVAGLTVLERELETLLSNWFDVGMLELKPITWDSPASLLEKLIQYEAVHEIRSWDELKHRVADNRRCYAFFHPRMSDVPLIFVEVAFAHQMADNVQVLLDPQTPAESLNKARWAIFYSISNTQPGLRGISFGNFLLKRVVDELLREMPRLKSFATLSPIPGFTDWLKKQDNQTLQALLHNRTETETRTDNQAGARWVAKLRKAAVGAAPELVQNAGLRLAAHYLTTMKNGRPIDPVARFHLENGARMERVNWAADRSAKGLEQSCALMVNYLYDLDELDQNLVQLTAGKPSLGRNLKRLLP